MSGPDGADPCADADLRAEVERLRDVNATLTRILGAIDEYVYSGEFLEDGTYVLNFAGPCRERFLGLSAEAARDAVWLDYVHPDEVTTFAVAHEEAMETGFLDLQYRLLGADGVQRWVRDRGRLHHVGGRHFLDGSVLDVTALHEAEERLVQHVDDIEVLATAHRELAAGTDPAAARHAVCRAVREVCGASGVGLYVPTRSELVLVDSVGVLPCATVLPTAETSGTAGAFLAAERSFVADAPTASGISIAGTGGTEVASVLFEPIRSGGTTVGVVTVVWDQRVDVLPPRIEALLPLIGTEVAVALERADLVDRLSLAAHTDALTGLPNRRALDGILADEVGRAEESGRALSLGVIDLDHFKAYNDTHGHPAGDALLREVGPHWLEVLRPGDALVRLGGEEFVVVLPGLPPGAANELLDDLRRATPGGQTCSIGVAAWDGVETVDDLMHRADQMMYAAKRSGRDRVMADLDAESFAS